MTDDVSYVKKPDTLKELIEKAAREDPESYPNIDTFSEWILEDVAIVEQIKKANSKKAYQNLVANILSKYEMMKILLGR